MLRQFCTTTDTAKSNRRNIISHNMFYALNTQSNGSCMYSVQHALFLT